MKTKLTDGFADHGIAVTHPSHRGVISTSGKDGHNIVLAWLYDHRGCYALLIVDIDSGESRQFPIPFHPGQDCPYTSLLSGKNMLYTHFNSHFLEFDPVQERFTFTHNSAPQMAMGMTEDDAGQIWSVSYPNSGVVCFDPETREFTDYPHVYSQNWMQYQRYVAADDAGWVYFGMGNTASQIIAFSPETHDAIPMLKESERVKGTACVYRDMNGKVYGASNSRKDAVCYEFHKGKATRLDSPPDRHEKPIITGSQGLFHDVFPDGRRLVRFDLEKKTAVIENPLSGTRKKLSFDYATEGARMMGVAAAPDGTICGGSGFPDAFVSFNPATSEWLIRPGYKQWNTVASQGNRFYAGGYTHGFLLEYDPSKPFVTTEDGKKGTNPHVLTEAFPDINRPHCLLACPDNETLIMGGTPEYGYTGGGLLFWNTRTGDHQVITHERILPDLSTTSMVMLPDGNLLGGTSVRAGTGGEEKASRAELYVMDMESRHVKWHGAMIDDAMEYMDMCAGNDGLVYGLIDRECFNPNTSPNNLVFFAFDSSTRKIVHTEETRETFGPTSRQQGQRKILKSPDGRIFVLFLHAIAEIDHATHRLVHLADSKQPIDGGGDILDERIYFVSASRLCSYTIPHEMATAIS